MIEAKSEKYAGLLVRFADGDAVHFVDGVASVTSEQAEKLNRLPDSSGVAVEGFISGEDDSDVAVGGTPDDTQNDVAEPEPEPESDDAELVEPKGNASLEDWVAYAIQSGVGEDDLKGLKREEVKALLEG
ncbi:hypothetical protein ACLQ8T_05785 [Glutamicibacter sp. FR1]|uniref:hypothetical protein n=1 Tax=Glutamicibacter sp. FR1 TaxID=3393744 RepID=UPI0039B07C9B